MDLIFLAIKNNIIIEEEKQEEKKEEKQEEQQEEKQQIKHLSKNTLYVRKFIENNKEKIHEKIECPICMSTYTYFNKSKHNKTKRHIKFLEKQVNILPFD